MTQPFAHGRHRPEWFDDAAHSVYSVCRSQTAERAVPSAVTTSAKGIMTTTGTGKLPVRGYLLHITHYDPAWCKTKQTEKPFELAVGLDVIDAMAQAGLNLLLLDCKDGVKYASHPELARPYTQTMDVVRELCSRAAAHGIEVSLKLNFSQSALHQHNHWFRPHNALFDRPEYWQKAWEVIDELLSVAKPPRFFHIGMDEDHWRSYTQYAQAIDTLHRGLAQRGLRTLIWNDSACAWPEAEIHREKSLYAEERILRDVIQVLWCYWDLDITHLQRLRARGFDVWGAPGTDPNQVVVMRDALRKYGGSGILLTRWMPCITENRASLLDHIRAVGPLCA